MIRPEVNKFYIAEYTYRHDHYLMHRVGVIQCTGYKKQNEYTETFFFKPDMYIQDSTEYNMDKSNNHSIKILKEITDKELQDTSIMFITDNYYLKKVNKETYKEYYFPEGIR